MLKKQAGKAHISSNTGARRIPELMGFESISRRDRLRRSRKQFIPMQAVFSPGIYLHWAPWSPLQISEAQAPQPLILQSCSCWMQQGPGSGYHCSGCWRHWRMHTPSQQCTPSALWRSCALPSRLTPLGRCLRKRRPALSEGFYASFMTYNFPSTILLKDQAEMHVPLQFT